MNVNHKYIEQFMEEIPHGWAMENASDAFEYNVLKAAAEAALQAPDAPSYYKAADRCDELLKLFSGKLQSNGRLSAIKDISNAIDDRGVLLRASDSGGGRIAAGDQYKGDTTIKVDCPTGDGFQFAAMVRDAEVATLGGGGTSFVLIRKADLDAALFNAQRRV